MGIYVFNRKLIRELLDNPLSDFGKHIIPHAINTHRVFSYVYQGYWEDIGTIRFLRGEPRPRHRTAALQFLRHERADFFSRPRFLPGSKINGAQIDHAVISDGCIINRARISNSIVGLRTIVGDGTELNRVVILGSDYYESQESVERHEREGQPRIGIGARTARSRTPSLTRTRASATTWSSRPPASRRTWTTSATSSATASSSSPRTPSSRTAR
jgi:glucose-1-phosphate adenylyltransferase